MNPAALPRWAVTALLLALFAGVPSLAYLLDGDLDGSQARARIVAQAGEQRR